IASPLVFFCQPPALPSPAWRGGRHLPPAGPKLARGHHCRLGKACVSRSRLSTRPHIEPLSAPSHPRPDDARSLAYPTIPPTLPTHPPTQSTNLPTCLPTYFTLLYFAYPFIAQPATITPAPPRPSSSSSSYDTTYPQQPTHLPSVSRDLTLRPVVPATACPTPPAQHETGGL
ncbi:hypothetical protein IAQ61_000318, partial [Plenodomus lingam]|uniref:uncharacterized protein n=1 Tax=Leptosphaeria maculans TaxID=5022 RepID=UPI00331B46B9